MSLIKWSRASERYGTIMLSRNLVVLLVGFVLVIQVSSLDLRPRAGSKIIGKALPAEGVPIIEGQEPVDTAIVKAVEIPEKKVTYEGTQLWKVFPEEKNAKFISYLQNAGGVFVSSRNDSAVDVLVRPERISRVSRFLRKRQVNYDILNVNLQHAIDQENPMPSAEDMEKLERCKGHRMEWSSYHRLEDIHGFLEYLAQTFSDLCSVMTIGYSVEGRPLKVLRISKGEPGVPAIWIDGGIHAREWISPASVTYIINYLVENSDELEADYYILPVVNPDGYEYTFSGDRFWRKNRCSSQKGSGCVGVDLNRNFGYQWSGMGASERPCSEIFAGTGPFSEPETKAIKNFFKANAAKFKAYLTFHSYGQYILYPWGYDRRVAPDHADLDKVGRLMASSMKKAGGAGSMYTVGNSAATLYTSSGIAHDWAKAALKIKYTYTIELRDTGMHGFVLPARYIVPTAEEALAAVNVVTKACTLL